MSAWEAQLLPRSRTGRELLAATRERTEDACAGPSAACTRAPVARTAHACTHPPGTAEHGHPAERRTRAQRGRGGGRGPSMTGARTRQGGGGRSPGNLRDATPTALGRRETAAGTRARGRALTPTRCGQPGAASAFPGSERAFSVTWKQRLDLKTTQGRPRVPARTCKHAWPHRPPGHQPREMRLQGLVPGGAHTPHWPPA